MPPIHPIRLETVRFPGGFWDHPDEPGVWRASPTIEPLIIEAVSLEFPVFAKFMNCTTDADLLQFLRLFWDQGRVERTAIQGQLNTMRSLAYLLVEGASRDIAADGIINGYLAGAALNSTLTASLKRIDREPELIIATTSTWEYMLFEVATAYQIGVTLGACQQCSKRFLHGATTGRRNTAKYCSEKCRSASKRARKKEPHDGHQTA